MSNLVIDPLLNPKQQYSRSKCTDRMELEAEMVKCFKLGKNSNSCVIFPSGMAAISHVAFAMMRANFENKDIIVNGSELYCDTPRCIQAWGNVFGARVLQQDVSVADAEILKVFEKFGAKVKMFFVESCSNPSGKMLNWDLLRKIKQLCPQIVVCVDNTWLTSVLFNPFQHGADLVVESLSKYRSDGKCIGGMVVGPKNLINVVRDAATLNGQFVGADHCKLFLNAQETLYQRVITAGTIADEVVGRLSQIQGVKVVHPKLKPHPSFANYQRYVPLLPGPSVFWMHIRSNCSLRDAETVKSAYLKVETSFGSKYSKIDPWPKIGASVDYDSQISASSNSSNSTNDHGVWLRISIGYEENLDFIMQELQNIIKNFAQI